MSPPKRVQSRLRLRLMVGLPALLCLYMFISGWAAQAPVFQSFFSGELTADVFRRVSFGWILIMVLLAFIGNLGAGVLISRHINRFISKLESSLRLEKPARPLIEATDEIEALGIVVDEVSTTLSKFVNDNYIIENLPEAVITVDSTLHVIRLNGNAAKLLEVDANEAMGRNLTDFIPRNQVNAAFFDMVDQGFRTGHFPLKLVALRLGQKRIQEVWVETHLLRGRTSPSGEGYVSISIKDKANILAVKHQIQKIERLAAVGSLASTMAHEVRNPLGAIMTFTELLREEIPAGDSKQLRYTEQILTQIGRLNELIENLLAFSRDSITNVTEFNVLELLGGTVQLAKDKFSKSRVTVDQHYASDLPLLKGDPEKLSRALLNMIINAFEACGQEGTVSVTASFECEGRTDGGAVCIGIADTGKGIPHEVLNKVLDPFFTTKANGTGLGLAISHNIVTAHGGRIEVWSEEGKGTRFQILLPRDHHFPEGRSEDEWSFVGHA